MFCNEREAVELVRKAVEEIDGVANIVVAKRVPLKENPLVYDVVIACQTSENNEPLVVRLLKLTLEEPDIEFAGSDLDVMQGGNSVNDFISVRATIRQLLTGA
jgi:hypothetical protein